MRPAQQLLILPVLLLAACGTAPADDDDDSTPDNTDYDPVRFVALGDTGEGNEAQYEVAAQMKEVCDAQGCDFVLLLGDNFYDTGVTGLDDVQWQEKFELPYAEIDLTFYAVLGNHDYGLLLPDEERVDFQIAYSEQSDKWYMPGHYYKHEHSNVAFYGLDSHAMFFGWEPGSRLEQINDAQRGFLQDEWANNDSPGWRIGYAHHPYSSNGVHGNAGEYDGLPPGTQLAGQGVKEFLENNVCGQVDLYITGHDHDREWPDVLCEGTELMVSGAGSKLRTIEGDDPTHFVDADTEGFVWIEIDDRSLTAQFWTKDGEMQYEGVIEK